MCILAAVPVRKNDDDTMLCASPHGLPGGCYRPDDERFAAYIHALVRPEVPLDCVHGTMSRKAGMSAIAYLEDAATGRRSAKTGTRVIVEMHVFPGCRIC